MSEKPIRTTVTETDLAIVTRHEYATGAVTIVREKTPPPDVTPPLRTVAEMGSLEVARREFDAATDRQAEDLATEWDLAWGVQ